MKYVTHTRRDMQNSSKIIEQTSKNKPSDHIKENANKTPHKIELDHLHGMSVSGVVDVPVFTDKSVSIRLNGETLLVNGNNLAVKSLDTQSGMLIIEGQIYQLKYSTQGSLSLAKRIFK